MLGLRIAAISLKVCACTILMLSVAIAYASPPADANINTGITSNGHPFKGDLEAPLTLIEYSDYLCPFCSRHHRITNPGLIEKYVASGKLKLEFRHFPIAALHPTAAKGHEAAACAAQQGADSFWIFHDALFTQQTDWNKQPDPDEFLVDLAAKLELNTEQWIECFRNRAEQKLVEVSVTDGKSKGFNGTPTFQLVSAGKQDNPYTITGARSLETFSNAIDAMLEGNQPPPPPQKKKPELPAWAKPDALAVDPNRLGFTVSGDPTHGSKDAPLTIVEFTDYQCPACAKHFSETQPAIEEKLIATGKVRWVSKHLPLPEHRNSMVAAAAVECAALQGLLGAMQKSLFEQQSEWSDIEKPDSTFVAMAADMGANLSDFLDCLNSRQALEGVLTDVYEATSVSRSTPSFLVLDGETGRPIRGARSPEKFIEGVLKHLETVLSSGSTTIQEKS